MSLRLSTLSIPAKHLLKNSVSTSNSPTLTVALQTYFKMKGNGKSRVFCRAGQRNINAVINLLGDRPIDEYSTSDASALRDHLIDKGLKVASITRMFSTIKSVINLTIREEGLKCNNAFSRTYMPDLDDSNQRQPIANEDIKSIQIECKKIDDEKRWLIALISDTGMRLSEAAGLSKDDIKVNESIPYVNIIPHSWRSLKTKSSIRKVPLVGASLWSARRILESDNDTPFAFPLYTNEKMTNSNSASAALNKWLRNRLGEGNVIHGFRHSMRDRLRAVECPSDLIDQIGGWSRGSVGEGYGKGYDLKVLLRWLDKVI
tara:strand:- start:255 stop:1205 length:951 start_codon:yes stop_codon:yes gene_type:complete